MTRIFLLVILFASLPTKRALEGSQTDSSLCPNGWIHLVSSCYNFNATKTTMSKANSSCQNQGGDLVLPRNLTEHDAIWKAAGENKLSRSWIGLHEGQQANIFYTLDGKIPSYTNWGLSQPDKGTSRGDEKCVAFYQKPNGEWHDVSCKSLYSYICQKPSCTNVTNCLNGGICLNGKCSCPSGFTGSRCHLDIDECKESPGICQNRANCTNTNGSYTCTCTAAYTGRNCSINIDDCKTDDGSSKCLNNGTCIDGEGKFSCKCQDPYFANCSCRNANWRSSFNRTGWSKCPATFPYINGLYRSSVSQPSRDYIYHLEQAKCCGNGNSNAECVQADWVTSFDKNNNWNLCPSGSYLSGLYRSSGNNLHNIERAWCCKPRGAPNSYKSCYNEDVWSKFNWNRQGMVSCTRAGYYITGMYRSSCDYMYCIEEFKCCQLQIKEACTNVTCLNGGICMNGTCSCHSGFTGSRCDVDIDECKESPGICQNRANCTNTNGSYTCTCTAAYTGRNCSINIDDCKTDDGSLKCLNNGTCIDGEDKFSCKCQDPYFGPLCAHNECTSLPCHNDGQCVVEDKGYRCKCRAGFTGVNCETPPDHCLSRPCQNNATCTTIGNTTFNCNCAAGFTGKNCSVNVDDCLSANCQNNALCRDGINEFKCVCGPGFHGPLCQYDVNECPSLPCQNNGNCTNTNGRYICECPLGFTGQNCEMSYVVSKDPISQLAQKEVNISNVVNVTKEVKKLSVSSHPLQAGDISNIATILQKIVEVKQKANETFDDFRTTIDNVLDASKKSVFRSQQKTDSSSRIVKALNDFLETLVIDSSGKFEKFERNFDALVQAVQPQTFNGLTFPGIVRKSHKSPLWNGRSVPQAPSSSISIPGTIFNESTITKSSRQQRIIFVLYKKTSFFKVSLEDTKKTSSRLNSFVIAGSIKGLSVRNLSNPVKIALQSVARGDTNSTLCSYWNFTLGNWSQEGCMFKRVLSDGRILCNCNHLTNFAMLMDIKPAVTTKHERILGVISIVGCALSLVGLTLTIITILIVRELRSTLPTKILLNYCIALSLMLIVFLATPEGSKSSSLARCRTAAVALHYFLLAAFLWMAVEAFSLYLAIIKSRKIDLYPCTFLLKCCVFAWGTPAVIVAITMIVALDKYGDERFCRLHGVPFFVAFVTPVILILVGNIVVFCLVIRSLLTSGKKVTSSLKVSSLQQARQGIAIMVLLGLTWLFGFLAIDDAKLAFQWLFCIFNSLQGFLVFILFCILPAGTRKHLRKLCSQKSSYQIREDPSTGSTAIGKMYSVNDQCSASGDELKTLDEESSC